MQKQEYKDRYIKRLTDKYEFPQNDAEMDYDAVTEAELFDGIEPEQDADSSASCYDTD